MSIAEGLAGSHTRLMQIGRWYRSAMGLVALVGCCLCVGVSFADEIRLKDGKKLYGVIVGYEENMFRVKTDFGYVLVEKDKIASIIPDGSAGSATAAADPAKKPEAASDPKPVVPTKDAATVRKEKAAMFTANSNARPELPTPAKTTVDSSAPALKTAVATPKTNLADGATPPPPPKEEAREEIQGNLYINHEFGFRMYKAPSWQIIEGAGQTLPNAIVAMGTNNESTLLVVGHEKNKASLEAASETIEKTLHDVYQNYRLLSQRKTVVGGQPAIEYRYRGMAEEHDWSGTLSVIAHNGEYLTVLGMTFGDSDLIQIQENVITRSITSLEFDAK